jgi:phosphoribosylanthranilate isomerase
MTWVKICGITNLEDAQTAVDAGADALGFVFYEKSPRYVTPSTVRNIVQQVPAQVAKVGVFVAGHTRDYLSIIQDASLTASQITLGLPTEPSAEPLGATTYGAGCFPPGFKQYWSLPAAFFIENKDGARKFMVDLAALGNKFSSQPNGERMKDFFQTIFIDSSNGKQPGGTGKTFEWNKAADILEFMRGTVQVVVAGGLTPENVGEAMRILHPWGVDVSSGVESSPGKKDPQKVRTFIQAVRASEKN